MAVDEPIRAAAPPHLLRRMDREPHAARVPAPRAGLPRLRERRRDGGATTASWWSGPPSRRPGNELIRAIGGRESTRSTCGWAASGERRPARAAPLVDRLEEARELALATVRWTAALDFPELEEDYEFVALSSPGRLSAGGRPAGLEPRARHRAGEYEEHFVEEQVPHSTALHSRLRERGSYLVGPMARYALNAERLSPLAREAAAEAGLEPVCRNPFRSIVVRSVEILYALDEALRLIDGYEEPDRPAVACRPVRVPATAGPRRRGDCCGTATRSTTQGTILDARIVPPTSQNQTRIEEDLYAGSCGATSISPTSRCGCAASRRSATTTRASPARRTLSSRSIGRDPAGSRRDARDRHGQRVAQRRRRPGSPWPAACATGCRIRGRDRARGRAACAGGSLVRLARDDRGGRRRSGAAPGTTRRLDASRERLPAELFRGSTHALGLAEAVELARALDRLPSGWSRDRGRVLCRRQRPQPCCSSGPPRS